MSVDTKIVEVAIGQVKGFFYPSEAEQAAAYELLVELTTRPSGSQLAMTETTIAEELDDLDALFEITRSILRTHGVDTTKGSSGNLSLAVVALRVLNEVFRPVIVRWRPLLDEHRATRPDDPLVTDADWERRWDRAAQCRTELARMRAETRAYIETLSHIAGAPAIAEAVLGAPSSTMFPRERIDASRHPADAPGLVPRRKMVRWFDPVEMYATWRAGGRANAGLERLGAERLGDGDVVEPDATFEAAAGDDFWFDYVSDMGDGFDGTAPVAWLIGRRSLSVPDHRAGDVPTPPARLPHAELLVFGGDEVYPFAAAGAYESQTELPYRMGLDDGLEHLPDDERPTLVAVAGNHDWLGGIEHFEQMFVSGRTFADHWRTVQSHNWFHVALPQGWWLWGVDTGLDNELVGDQEEYFRRAADSLRPGDRVILCTPVPLWQMRAKHPEEYAHLRSVIDPLVRGRRATMPLCLSGDTHMFAHMERVDTDEGEDHITAGGGGAFLQPTHNLPERVPVEGGNAEFRLTSRWPLPADSRSIAPGGSRPVDPQFWALWVLAGVLHLAVGALAAWRFGEMWTLRDGTATSDSDLSWWESAGWVIASPWAATALVLIALLGVIAFRGNSVEPKLGASARVYGAVAGGSISLTIYLIAVTRRSIEMFTSWPWLLGSAIVGGVVAIAAFMSVVRWANRRIRAGDSLAFLPAYSTRYKHFLRFRIDVDGDLTCYAIGVDPVGDGWYEAMTPAPGTVGSVPPYDPAGTPRLHYVWGRTYPKFVPTSIDVAVSISDPDGTTPADPTSEHRAGLVDTFEQLAADLIDRGHTLLYGGLPDLGFTERLHEIDRERHRDNPNAEPHIVTYVAEQYWTDAAADDAPGADMVRRIRARRWPIHGESEVQRDIRNLTAMRTTMTDHADVRIAIGGALRPGAPRTRSAPGVIEEAYLAIDAGLPLVVAGGFGGAAGLIADALLGRLDATLVEELDEHFLPVGLDRDIGIGFTQMLGRFTSVGVLRNGLTDGENREVLLSRDPRTVASLITRSVQRIGNAAPR